MIPHRWGPRELARAAPAVLFLFFCSVAAALPAEDASNASPVPRPPLTITAEDTPNDRGESIDLKWRPSPDETDPSARALGYSVERAGSPDGPFEQITTLPIGTTSYTDNSVRDEDTYYYRVSTTGSGEGPWTPGPIGGPVRSRGQWFDARKFATLLLTFLFCLTVILLIRAARRGKTFYVRPIPGLSAVDEAIGRATEMGKPILFVPGISVAGEVATLAAFTLLGRVAKKTAEYQTPVLVPCADPIVMTIAQEIVKSSYMDAGRPELYRQQDVYFVTQDQFSYTAAVNGVMLRERPATNFYIGKFYAESLVLAETGNIAGSIQIAGTDEITQIPFFVAACDYTLIGEELYASSAYLSQEPPLLGTLKAQDYGKAVGAILILVGALMAVFRQTWFVDFFKVQ